MSVWVYPVGIAVLAVAIFVVRRPIRRLYAPPHGRRALATTWGLCLVTAVSGCVVGASHLSLGVGLICGAAFIGLVASRLHKEERNRAIGLPDDYTAIPERLGWLTRMTFGIGSLGAAWLAAYMAGSEAPGDVLHAWGAVALAATLGAAALTGRPSKRLRRQLGAELTPEQAEELRRRSLANRRNPERAIPLDRVLEQSERELR